MLSGAANPSDASSSLADASTAVTGTAPATTSSAPAAAPNAAAAAAAPRPALAPQLSPPILALTQAGDGNHELTLTVSPENLGPVTVRAHISGHTMHIELFAPSDAGRDALRHILADLRRDLAGAAPQASLTLTSGDQPAGQQSAGNPAGSTGGTLDQNGRGGQAAGHGPNGTPRGSTAGAEPLPVLGTAPQHPSPTTSIDIFA